jgi:hypothetical protein
MSPAKSTSKLNPEPKALTIEFSGICTLIWNRKAGNAEVKLVDLGSAGFQRHYAALGLTVAATETDTLQGVKGPDADAAVSLLGEDTDVGLWNLRGSDVEFVGATGTLTVDDSKVDVTKKPPKNGGSIQWLANVSVLCESQRLDPVCPTATIIRIPAGHISSIGGETARKVQFLADGTPVGPAQYVLPRFQAVIPFERELAMKLTRERVFRFSNSATIMISNTCVCGLGLGRPANHFYGHYEVVQPKRRPIVEPAGPKPMFPSFPELCFPAIVRT